VGAARAAAGRGRPVPESLSVVGYDNTSLAELWQPALTTIDQPRLDMGRLAVTMLRERLGGRREDRHETLTPRLVIRASTAPPPA
jgi:DNA-binding LacI/PurR family transcriptional regulator